MGFIQNLTEKMFSGSQFYGIWEKYISTLENFLKSGFDMPESDRKKIMEFIADAYEKLGDKAEAVSWRARAMAEAVSAESKRI